MRRNLNMIHLRFGTFNLTKQDLVNLEKLILDNITLTDRSDHYVGLGRSREWFVPAKRVYSSARYIPDKPHIYHRAEIRVKAPNILVAFSPRKTEVFVAREFYKGEVLHQQSVVAKEVERYLQERSVARSPLGKLFHRNTIRRGTDLLRSLTRTTISAIMYSMTNHNQLHGRRANLSPKQLAAAGLLALTLAGGLIGGVMRGNGGGRQAQPNRTPTVQLDGHNVVSGANTQAIPTSTLEHSWSLAHPIVAPDGHSELVIGTAVKGGGPGPKATELFVSTDNGADWRPVVANATDAVWAPSSYVKDGQDQVFAALYNSTDGAGTSNIVTSPDAPDYVDNPNYVGLFQVGAGGVTELAAAQCEDTSLQPLKGGDIPHGEIGVYHWDPPKLGRTGHKIATFTTYQIIGGENPDGTTWIGGMQDASVDAPIA